MTDQDEIPIGSLMYRCAKGAYDSIVTITGSLFETCGLTNEKTPEYFVVDHFLDDAEFLNLRELALGNKNKFIRSNSCFRSGAAMNAHQMKAGPCKPILKSLVSDKILREARAITGNDKLQYYPESDPNLISLLYYGGYGDGIDWHCDGNGYKGQRWVGIFTLKEDTNDFHSKIELIKDGAPQLLKRSQMENRLVLFQGDKVPHRVRGLADGEERLVVNLIFTDDPEPTKGLIRDAHQAMTNYYFYGCRDTIDGID